MWVWIVLVAAGWVVTAVALALLVGGGVRIAEQRRPRIGDAVDESARPERELDRLFVA